MAAGEIETVKSLSRRASTLVNEVSVRKKTKSLAAPAVLLCS